MYIKALITQLVIVIFLIDNLHRKGYPPMLKLDIDENTKWSLFTYTRSHVM